MSNLLHRAEEVVTGRKHISRSQSDYGPRDSKTANKVDSRVDSDHDHYRQATPTTTVPREGKTAGNANKPYPDDILTDGTVGAHNAEVANRVEQRVVPDSEYHAGHRSKGGRDGMRSSHVDGDKGR